MRKAKIQKLPMFTDIRAGETVWTPDGIQTAPLTARRFVFLDCRNRKDEHLRFEFCPLNDYIKTEDALVYGVTGYTDAELADKGLELLGL